ncbi:hypothetical protein P7K49_016728 [Saguinus oedipus]|uniref:Uncharacterized protein n=1 Tax=Saguinus oedipus TaxID=9490 RepID=A0ABQ9VE92_SAGOE|nr:hypothetical protein P7K49_016728 [Saguinus oedipus]
MGRKRGWLRHYVVSLRAKRGAAGQPGSHWPQAWAKKASLPHRDLEGAVRTCPATALPQSSTRAQTGHIDRGREVRARAFAARSPRPRCLPGSYFRMPARKPGALRVAASSTPRRPGPRFPTGLRTPRPTESKGASLVIQVWS